MITSGRRTWTERFREGIDYEMLQGQDLQEFLEALSQGERVNTSISRLMILYPSGIQLVLLNTAKPIRKKLHHWLVDEVFASPHEPEPYPFTPERILENTKRPVQIQHTKKVASYLYARGKKAIIRWMTNSFIGVKGMRPSTYVHMAYQGGGITNKNLSGREALRRQEPPKACVVSLMDQLRFEFKAEERVAIDVAKQFEPGFKAILNAGLQPAELASSPAEQQLKQK